MLTLYQDLQQAAASVLKEAYDLEIDPTVLNIQETRKEFEGDFTLVVFPLSRYRLGAPHEVADKLGQLLEAKLDYISGYNVVKGFLNLSLSPEFWLNFLLQYQNEDSLIHTEDGQNSPVVVEYCSPNTNKPLHLGHLRNIILGYSLNEILKANGYASHPVCLYNDRGTAICKSMYTWQLAGGVDTPESLGVKGDVVVGDYYVKFSELLKIQVAEGMAQGLDQKEAEKQAPANQAINEMLVKWEAGDPEVRELWSKLNGWVYAAHKNTFEKLGVEFEKFYYESDVYQNGKTTVQEGLERGVFYQKEDGSVWVDLESVGLDQKLLLRANGTSIYITQDLAIAEAKDKDFHMTKSIYVVGNEQDYHFKVLFEVLKKLEKPYSKGLHHLSYGIVELPDGRMKSREGTIVEADDLLDEMLSKAKEATQELGKIEEMSEGELQELYRALALGAIKFYLVKVDPKKGMVFDPKESIDLHGHTGPYVQYAYTRTAAIQRKAGDIATFDQLEGLEEELHATERQLLKQIFKYPETLRDAANAYNPAAIANYVYELARAYNGFYRECKVIQEDKPKLSAMRYALSGLAGKVIQEALRLLGIETPARM